MDFTSLLIYTLTLLLAVASPGPAVAAIVGFVLANGLRGAFYFIAGIIFGEFFWLAASFFGVEALVNAFPQALLVLRLVGACFIFYMAYEMYKAAGEAFSALEISNDAAFKLFMGGLTLSASNPKVMVFYLSLLPSLIAGKNLGFEGYVVYALIMLVVTTSVFAVYAFGAAKARELLNSPQKLKRVRQGNAVLLALLAVIILVSAL